MVLALPTPKEMWVADGEEYSPIKRIFEVDQTRIFGEGASLDAGFR
jgi:hypothetical protein